MATYPNITTLEIAITYACNVRCANCCSLSTQAPTGRADEMPVETIERFIAESIEAAYPWGYIKLYGGQPTMHTRFMDICRLLAAYRDDHHHSLGLGVVTNGSDQEKIRASEELGFGRWESVKVKTNADAAGNAIPYITINRSPKDIGLEAPSGCWVPAECGICMTNDGFWACSPIAAASRVFGYESEVKHVGDITTAALVAQYYHCDHCGYAAPDEPRAVEQVTSETWQKKLEDYNAKRNN